MKATLSVLLVVAILALTEDFVVGTTATESAPDWLDRV